MEARMNVLLSFNMAWDRINDGVRKNALQQGTPMTTPNN
jgi:hypothetical protein